MYFDCELITIVTATLNCADLIESTIQSVCTQKYPNKEHLIVDGGSEDATIEIINSYQRCISKLVSEKDDGIYDAMNKGIQLASPESRYITFLNAGDVYTDENVLHTMLAKAKLARAHLYGNISVEKRIVSAPEKLNRWTLSTNMICHQACFFRTEIHRKFLYDTQYKIAADYKLFLDLIHAGESFEKVELIVAEMDVSGVSHSQRSLLLAEKDEIRRQYPIVYFYAGVKNIFKNLYRLGRE